MYVLTLWLPEAFDVREMHLFWIFSVSVCSMYHDDVGVVVVAVEVIIFTSDALSHCLFRKDTSDEILQISFSVSPLPPLLWVYL